MWAVKLVCAESSNQRDYWLSQLAKPEAVNRTLWPSSHCRVTICQSWRQQRLSVAILLFRPSLLCVNHTCQALLQELAMSMMSWKDTSHVNTHMDWFAWLCKVMATMRETGPSCTQAGMPLLQSWRKPKAAQVLDCCEYVYIVVSPSGDHTRGSSSTTWSSWFQSRTWAAGSGCSPLVQSKHEQPT